MPVDLVSSQTIYAKNLPIAWTSYANEPKDIFKWRRCQGSKLRFEKSKKSETKEKEAPHRLTQVGQKAQVRQVSASLKETKA